MRAAARAPGRARSAPLAGPHVGSALGRDRPHEPGCGSCRGWLGCRTASWGFVASGKSFLAIGNCPGTLNRARTEGRGVAPSPGLTRGPTAFDSSDPDVQLAWTRRTAPRANREPGAQRAGASRPVAAPKTSPNGARRWPAWHRDSREPVVDALSVDRNEQRTPEISPVGGATGRCPGDQYPRRQSALAELRRREVPEARASTSSSTGPCAARR